MKENLPPQGRTKVWNGALMLSQIREKLNTPTDYESFIAIEKTESLLVKQKNVLSSKKRLQSFCN